MTDDQLRALRYLHDKCAGFGDETIRAGDVAEFLDAVLNETPRMREPFFPAGASTVCSACGTYKGFYVACKDCLRCSLGARSMRWIGLVRKRLEKAASEKPDAVSGEGPHVLVRQNDLRALLDEAHTMPDGVEEAIDRPTVAVLCGSTRFRTTHERLARTLTLERGYIVLSCCVWGHQGDAITEVQKAALDELHKRKIDMADEVWIVSEDDYIGESTRGEIGYAEARGKPTFRYDISPAPVSTMPTVPDGVGEAVEHFEGIMKRARIGGIPWAGEPHMQTILAALNAAQVEVERLTKKLGSANATLRAYHRYLTDMEIPAREKAEAEARGLRRAINEMCDNCRSGLDNEQLAAPCDHDLSLCPLTGWRGMLDMGSFGSEETKTIRALLDEAPAMPEGVGEAVERILAMGDAARERVTEGVRDDPHEADYQATHTILAALAASRAEVERLRGANVLLLEEERQATEDRDTAEADRDEAQRDKHAAEEGAACEVRARMASEAEARGVREECKKAARHMFNWGAGEDGIPDCAMGHAVRGDETPYQWYLRHCDDMPRQVDPPPCPDCETLRERVEAVVTELDGVYVPGGLDDIDSKARYDMAEWILDILRGEGEA